MLCVIWLQIWKKNDPNSNITFNDTAGDTITTHFNGTFDIGWGDGGNTLGENEPYSSAGDSGFLVEGAVDGMFLNPTDNTLYRVDSNGEATPFKKLNIS